MTDVLTREQRSRCMSRIRSKNTRPELKVRSALHALGFRYRLHDKRLPGCPDLVFSKNKVAVSVNGCFWHMHSCHLGAATPKTNAAFWAAKRMGNVQRDKRASAALRRLGWRHFVVWECICRRPTKLQRQISRIASVLRERTDTLSS